MNAVLDDQTTTVVFEDLEFEIPCGVVDDHPAEVALKCRSCGEASIICRPHLQVFREWLEARRKDVVTCKGCGFFGVELDDVAEVVPL